ncbi:hypothetical protein AC579_8882 [Pseudocercospora musae]|uniref:Uncharacterized protein n=1 Tax=Pseudocercospora musae TaxID=113226 RepID=A0A139I6V4_9PEZI|nr:hypothetical protein AC579_8882 [Pseudocercospora musae]
MRSPCPSSARLARLSGSWCDRVRSQVEVLLLARQISHSPTSCQSTSTIPNIMKPTLFSAVMLGTATAISLPSPPQPYGHSDIKKRACSQAEVALATGIHLNINAQYSEYNGTVKVDQVEGSKESAAEFNNAKGQLQADIQGGMNIRLFNQQIAPAGNPAIPGLATYAAAQETEKAQAAGLTGNYDVDKPVLEMLKTEIMKGIKLNQANLAAATSECDFTLVFPPENEMGV